MKIDCKKVIELRRVRHWTQEDLAAASGLSGRTVQRVETNCRSSLATSRALAAAFDVKIEDLTNDINHTDVAQNKLLREKPRVGFWMIASAFLIVGITALSFLVLTYVARYHDGVLKTFSVAWLIVQSVLALGMLFLAPIFLIVAGICLAQQKLKVARRFAILSFCAFLGFAIGGAILSSQPLTTLITPLVGLYLAIYAMFFGSLEILKRKHQYKP